MKDRARAGILMLVLSLVLAACSNGDAGQTGSSEDPEDPTSTPSETVADLPTLEVVVPTVDAEHLDPALFESTGQHHQYQLVFDTLLKLSPEDGTMSPGLATKWYLGDNGTDWVLELREDVYFQDGEQMTAEDVKFSLERYMASAGLGGARIREYVKSVDIVDDFTVAIRTDAAPTLPFDLGPDPGSAAGYVVPRHYVEEVGDEEFNRAPVGTGPFVFDGQRAGQDMTFSANAEYWGGAPGVGGIRLQIVPDATARLALLRTGEAHIATGITGPAIPTVLADDALKVTVAERVYMTYFAVGGQAEPGSPLSKVEVRRAISTAIDRQTIVDTLLHGYGAPTYLHTFPFSAGYPEDADEHELPYDVAAAKKLLADAGYPNGFDLKVVAAVSGREFGEAVAQNLAAIGIKVDLQVLDTAAALEDLAKNRAETRVVLVFGPNGVAAKADPSSTFFNHLFPGNTYAQQETDPELSSWIQAQATETDPEAREQMLSDIAVRIFENQNMISLWHSDVIFALSGDVEEWSPVPGWPLPANLQSARLRAE